MLSHKFLLNCHPVLRASLSPNFAPAWVSSQWMTCLYWGPTFWLKGTWKRRPRRNQKEDQEGIRNQGILKKVAFIWYLQTWNKQRHFSCIALLIQLTLWLIRLIPSFCSFWSQQMLVINLTSHPVVHAVCFIRDTFIRDIVSLIKNTACMSSDGL